MTQAKKGMGAEAGNELLDKAFRKKFGATINQLRKYRLLSTDLECRFEELLKERNWLVHESRGQNRNAIHSDPVAVKSSFADLTLWRMSRKPSYMRLAHLQNSM